VSPHTPFSSIGKEEIVRRVIGRAWLKRRPLPDDETMAIKRHLRELDRLGEDLELLDREVAKNALDDPAIKRLLTITG
jgi:transposase